MLNLKNLTMNRIITCILLALSPGLLHAQAKAPINLPPTLFLADVAGIRLASEWNHNLVKGTPFLKENWGTAVVTLKDNRSFEKVSIRLNCVNNTVHYQNARKDELVAPDGLIKQLLIRDSSEKGTSEYLIASGYPAIDKQTEQTFYEKKVSGKAELLLFTKKRLMSVETMGSAGKEQEYLTIESYYLYRNGVIREWKKDKDFLLDFLSDRKAAIDTYIKTEKLKCRSIEDVKKVLEYYNGLS